MLKKLLFGLLGVSLIVLAAYGGYEYAIYRVNNILPYILQSVFDQGVAACKGTL